MYETKKQPISRDCCDAIERAECCEPKKAAACNATTPGANRCR